MPGGNGISGEAKSRHLFLHLGMAQTATGFLQGRLFPFFENVRFLDHPAAARFAEPAVGAFFRCSPLIWRQCGAELFAELCGELEPNRSVLISDQTAGPRLSVWRAEKGKERDRLDPAWLQRHLEEIVPVAERAGFHSVKAIVVFRRQDDWLASDYAHRAKGLRGVGQADFEERVEQVLAAEEGFFTDGILLNYHALFRNLVAALGPGNVRMLPYELFVRSPGKFIADVVDFLGETDRDGLIARLAAEMDIERRNTRPLPRGQWSLEKDGWRVHPRKWLRWRRIPDGITIGRPRLWPAKRIVVTPELSRRILHRYAASNRTVEKELGIELEPLGYYTQASRTAGFETERPVAPTPSKASSL